MTPEQKAILRDTWRQVVPIAETAARLFYERLFAIDPTTRPLFKNADMAAQGVKLTQALALVVNGLDRLEDLLPKIEELGRRHVVYGVTEAHFVSVGAALLWTLEQGLGAAWTPAANDAWTQAYVTISGVMCQAMAEQVAAAA